MKYLDINLKKGVKNLSEENYKTPNNKWRQSMFMNRKKIE